MLRELKISNFRIFDDEVRLRFRPITVLIGRNSSGKSSIIKFLLMLQQSSVPGQSRFLNPEGNRVSLGAFAALKNSLTKKRNLVFELSVSTSSRRFRPFLTRQLKSPSVGKEEIFWCQVQANTLYSRRTSRGKALYSLTHVTNDSSTDRLLAFSRRALEDSSLWDPPPFPSEFYSSSSSTADHNVARSARSRLARMERLQTSLARRNAERSIVDTLRYQITSIRHLLPVRVESQRVILASFPPADDVGQSGEYTLPHLQQLVTESSEAYELIGSHLENIAGIDAIRFRTSSGYLTQAFARNRDTGADVLIADYGFGVGQCLPILVQGAIMAPQTTLMVEQPEAQLHPTAQLELGSFFAELWNKRRVGSIIETHSDNILLRLRRLIARRELSPEDVSVAYFTLDEHNRNMPVIKNLDIREDGSMESGLPLEFFGANVIEGLRLGAKA